MLYLGVKKVSHGPKVVFGGVKESNGPKVIRQETKTTFNGSNIVFRDEQRV